MVSTVSYRRFWAIVSALCLFGGSVVFSILYVLAPAPAPAEIVVGPALNPRLTPRLLLVIVDGLRHDVATDPARMPHFSQAMRSHLSGESWASSVSMTSSGVLGLGTGQRGRLEQVVRNLSSKRPPFNSWLANARRSGVKIAVAGDLGWWEMYGDGIVAMRRDPEGVAGDADFNAQTFANTRELLAGNYDAVVAHFVTPDHQGHTYGVQSERYARHIHGFDADLARLLAALDSTWTVIVTSDHGASDTGKHGTDLAVERRSPVYAYGPGITELSRPKQSIEQLDLSATLPVLLGVSPPAHGTGAVLSDWLRLSESEAANVACEHARRVVDYARVVASRAAVAPASAAISECASENRPQLRSAAALRAVRASDRAVSNATGLASPSRVPLLCGVGGALLVSLLAIFGRGLDVRALVSGALVLGVTVLLVREVERLPGAYPNVVRGTLLALGNAVLLALILWPARVLRLTVRGMPYTLALLPGILVFGYPADVAPEAFVTTAIASFVLMGSLASGTFDQTRGGFRSRSTRRWLPWALALAALAPTLYRQNATYSGLLPENSQGALASIALTAALYAMRRPLGSTWRELLPLWVVALAPIWLRSVLDPLSGRSAWLLTAGSFVFELLQQRNRARASWLGMCTCLWLARSFESLPLVALVVLCWSVGEAAKPADEQPNPAADLLLTTLGFCAIFTLRIGLQDGLDLGGMDFGAGVFHDLHVGAIWVGFALVFKYVLAMLTLLLALSHQLTAERMRGFARALLAAATLRVFALTCTFFVAGSSYWTAFRIIGDLPAMLALDLCCLLFLGFVKWQARLQQAVSHPLHSTLVPVEPGTLLPP